MPVYLKGLGVSRGIAIGDVHMIRGDYLDIQERPVDQDSVENEVVRFRAAVARARAELRQIRYRIPANTPAEIQEFIDTHVLMLEDSSLTDATAHVIRSQHCNAEWALKTQRDILFGIFSDIEDPYLRSRKDDLDQVVNRIHRALSETQPDSGKSEADSDEPEQFHGRILVADDIAPADLALLAHQGLAGFVSEFGGPLSHTAILARSLKLPAVVGVRNIRTMVDEGEPVVIDGERGAIIADPDRHILHHYRRRAQEKERYYRGLAKLRHRPAMTLDGERVLLQANVELPQDLDLISDTGADGVGLYRTEFLFMNRPEPPSEDEQFEAYRSVVQALQGSPVTIRTIDLGADKQVDGGRVDSGPVAANPALGLRAIRLCLHDLDLFKPQLRAILRASAYGPVKLLIPMLTNTQELFRVRHLLASTRQELTDANVAMADHIPLGGMIEVPAAALSTSLFAKYLDFMSIGTNDLIQYTLAVDRVVDEVNYLYDPLHPAILKLLNLILDAASRSGTPMGMCGEMAGDLTYTRLLLGLGLRDFSMHPATLLEVKSAVNSSQLTELAKQTRRVLRATNPERITSLLRQMNSGVA